MGSQSLLMKKRKEDKEEKTTMYFDPPFTSVFYLYLIQSLFYKLIIHSMQTVVMHQPKKGVPFFPSRGQVISDQGLSVRPP